MKSHGPAASNNWFVATNTFLPLVAAVIGHWALLFLSYYSHLSRQMQHDPCELQSVHSSICKLLNSSALLRETCKCYTVRPCTWLSLWLFNSSQNLWKDLSAKNETWMSTGLEFCLLWILKQWLDPCIFCTGLGQK